MKRPWHLRSLPASQPPARTLLGPFGLGAAALGLSPPKLRRPRGARLSRRIGAEEKRGHLSARLVKAGYLFASPASLSSPLPLPSSPSFPFCLLFFCL